MYHPGALEEMLEVLSHRLLRDPVPYVGKVCRVSRDHTDIARVPFIPTPGVGQLSQAVAVVTRQQWSGLRLLSAGDSLGLGKLVGGVLLHLVIQEYRGVHLVLGVQEGEEFEVWCRFGSSPGHPADAGSSTSTDGRYLLGPDAQGFLVAVLG